MMMMPSDCSGGEYVMVNQTLLGEVLSQNDSDSTTLQDDYI